MGAVKRFKRGGVKPLHEIHEGKELSKGSSISELPAPDKVYIPLSQHIGAPNKPLVKKGDEVCVGQVLAESEAFVSAPVHSSVSGKVHSIVAMPGITGGFVDHAVIDNDGQYTLDASIKQRGEAEINGLSAQDICGIIRAAGIVGEGGAAFPSHVKLAIPEGKQAEYLLLNGAECEPFLTADYRTMVERPEQVLRGTAYLMRALGVDKAIVGIEDNKPEAISAMEKEAAAHAGIEVQALRTKYPQGYEKDLTDALLGREVPDGGLPIDVGCVIFNVGTCAAVCDAVENGMPLVKRIVTITGDVNQPSNFEVRVGTQFAAAIEAAGGYKGTPGKLISGGPMMGFAQYADTVSVAKGTSGIVVMDDSKASVPDEMPCFRCGKCVSVCPMGLVPLSIDQYSRKSNWDMADDYNAASCCECGCCSYICPSKRQLAQTIRLAKNEILAQRRKQAQQAAAQKEAK